MQYCHSSSIETKNLKNNSFVQKNLKTIQKSHSGTHIPILSTHDRQTIIIGFSDKKAVLILCPK